MMTFECCVTPSVVVWLFQTSVFIWVTILRHHSFMVVIVFFSYTL
jgi:hypothetical protein